MKFSIEGEPNERPTKLKKEPKYLILGACTEPYLLWEVRALGKRGSLSKAKIGFVGLTSYLSLYRIFHLTACERTGVREVEEAIPI